MNRLYFLGISAAFVYVVAVILGGNLWLGYDHISQAISELSAHFAPNQALMVSLFGLYNVLLLGFSGVYYKWAQNKQLKISAVVLGMIAVLGGAMLVFSQDKLGDSITLAGQLHLIAAGITSLATLVAIAFSVIGFKKLRFNKAAKIALYIGVTILVTGPLTAVATTAMPEYFGLLERITIGAFLVWVILVSLMIRFKAQ